MKRKQSIKSLSILVGILYGLFVISTLRNEFKDFKMGFLLGYHSAKDNDPNLDGNVYFLKVEPKKGVLDFSQSIQNLKMDTNLAARYSNIEVLVPNSFKLSQKLKIYDAIKGLLSIILVICFLWVPFIFYRIIKLYSSELIFNDENIKRLRMLGRLIGVIYLVMFICDELSNSINSSLFDFANYKIVESNTSYLGILLAFIILILAETIARGIEMKKEQELTI